MQRQKPLRMRSETWSCLNLTPKTFKNMLFTFPGWVFHPAGLFGLVQLASNVVFQHTMY